MWVGKNVRSRFFPSGNPNSSHVGASKLARTPMEKRWHANNQNWLWIVQVPKKKTKKQQKQLLFGPILRKFTETILQKKVACQGFMPEWMILVDQTSLGWVESTNHYIYIYICFVGKWAKLIVFQRFLRVSLNVIMFPPTFVSRGSISGAEESSPFFASIHQPMGVEHRGFSEAEGEWKQSLYGSSRSFLGIGTGVGWLGGLLLR